MSDAWSNLLTNILIKTDLANEELTKKDKTDFALISHILEQGYAFNFLGDYTKTELQRHIEEFIADRFDGDLFGLQRFMRVIQNFDREGRVCRNFEVPDDRYDEEVAAKDKKYGKPIPGRAPIITELPDAGFLHENIIQYLSREGHKFFEGLGGQWSAFQLEYYLHSHGREVLDRVLDEPGCPSCTSGVHAELPPGWKLGYPQDREEREKLKSSRFWPTSRERQLGDWGPAEPVKCNCQKLKDAGAWASLVEDWDEGGTFHGINDPISMTPEERRKKMEELYAYLVMEHTHKFAQEHQDWMEGRRYPTDKDIDEYTLDDMNFAGFKGSDYLPEGVEGTLDSYNLGEYQKHEKARVKRAKAIQEAAEKELNASLMRDLENSDGGELKNTPLMITAQRSLDRFLHTHKIDDEGWREIRARNKKREDFPMWADALDAAAKQKKLDEFYQGHLAQFLHDLIRKRWREYAREFVLDPRFGVFAKPMDRYVAEEDDWEKKQERASEGDVAVHNHENVYNNHKLEVAHNHIQNLFDILEGRRSIGRVSVPGDTVRERNRRAFLTAWDKMPHYAKVLAVTLQGPRGDPLIAKVINSNADGYTLPKDMLQEFALHLNQRYESTLDNPALDDDEKPVTSLPVHDIMNYFSYSPDLAEGRDTATGEGVYNPLQGPRAGDNPWRSILMPRNTFSQFQSGMDIQTAIAETERKQGASMSPAQRFATRIYWDLFSRMGIGDSDKMALLDEERQRLSRQRLDDMTRNFRRGSSHSLYDKAAELNADFDSMTQVLTDSRLHDMGLVSQRQLSRLRKLRWALYEQKGAGYDLSNPRDVLKNKFFHQLANIPTDIDEEKPCPLCNKDGKGATPGVSSTGKPCTGKGCMNVRRAANELGYKKGMTELEDKLGMVTSKKLPDIPLTDERMKMIEDLREEERSLLRTVTDAMQKRAQMDGLGLVECHHCRKGNKPYTEIKEVDDDGNAHYKRCPYCEGQGQTTTWGDYLLAYAHNVDGTSAISEDDEQARMLAKQSKSARGREASRYQLEERHKALEKGVLKESLGEGYHGDVPVALVNPLLHQKGGLLDPEELLERVEDAWQEATQDLSDFRGITSKVAQKAEKAFLNAWLSDYAGVIEEHPYLTTRSILSRMGSPSALRENNYFRTLVHKLFGLQKERRDRGHGWKYSDDMTDELDANGVRDYLLPVHERDSHGLNFALEDGRFPSGPCTAEGCTDGCDKCGHTGKEAMRHFLEENPDSEKFSTNDLLRMNTGGAELTFDPNRRPALIHHPDLGSVSGSPHSDGCTVCCNGHSPEAHHSHIWGRRGNAAHFRMNWKTPDMALTSRVLLGQLESLAKIAEQAQEGQDVEYTSDRLERILDKIHNDISKEGLKKTMMKSRGKDLDELIQLPDEGGAWTPDRVKELMRERISLNKKGHESECPICLELLRDKVIGAKDVKTIQQEKIDSAKDGDLWDVVCTNKMKHLIEERGAEDKDDYEEECSLSEVVSHLSDLEKYGVVGTRARMAHNALKPLFEELIHAEAEDEVSTRKVGGETLLDISHPDPLVLHQRSDNHYLESVHGHKASIAHADKEESTSGGALLHLSSLKRWLDRLEREGRFPHTKKQDDKYRELLAMAIIEPYTDRALGSRILGYDNPADSKDKDHIARLKWAAKVLGKKDKPAKLSLNEQERLDLIHGQSDIAPMMQLEKEYLSFLNRPDGQSRKLLGNVFGMEELPDSLFDFSVTRKGFPPFLLRESYTGSDMADHPGNAALDDILSLLEDHAVDISRFEDKGSPNARHNAWLYPTEPFPSLEWFGQRGVGGVNPLLYHAWINHDDRLLREFAIANDKPEDYYVVTGKPIDEIMESPLVKEIWQTISRNPDAEVPTSNHKGEWPAFKNEKGNWLNSSSERLFTRLEKLRRELKMRSSYPQRNARAMIEHMEPFDSYYGTGTRCLDCGGWGHSQSVLEAARDWGETNARPHDDMDTTHWDDLERQLRHEAGQYNNSPYITVDGQRIFVPSTGVGKYGQEMLNLDDPGGIGMKFILQELSPLRGEKGEEGWKRHWEEEQKHKDPALFEKDSSGEPDFENPIEWNLEDPRVKSWLFKQEPECPTCQGTHHCGYCGGHGTQASPPGIAQARTDIALLLKAFDMQQKGFFFDPETGFTRAAHLALTSPAPATEAPLDELALDQALQMANRVTLDMVPNLNPEYRQQLFEDVLGINPQQLDEDPRQWDKMEDAREQPNGTKTPEWVLDPDNGILNSPKKEERMRAMRAYVEKHLHKATSHGLARFVTAPIDVKRILFNRLEDRDKDALRYWHSAEIQNILSEDKEEEREERDREPWEEGPNQRLHVFNEDLPPGVNPRTQKHLLPGLQSLGESYLSKKERKSVAGGFPALKRLIDLPLSGRFVAGAPGESDMTPEQLEGLQTGYEDDADYWERRFVTGEEPTRWDEEKPYKHRKFIQTSENPVRGYWITTETEGTDAVEEARRFVFTTPRSQIRWHLHGTENDADDGRMDTKGTPKKIWVPNPDYDKNAETPQHKGYWIYYLRDTHTGNIHTIFSAGEGHDAGTVGEFDWPSLGGTHNDPLAIKGSKARFKEQGWDNAGIANGVGHTPSTDYRHTSLRYNLEAMKRNPSGTTRAHRISEQFRLMGDYTPLPSYVKHLFGDPKEHPSVEVGKKDPKTGKRRKVAGTVKALLNKLNNQSHSNKLSVYQTLVQDTANLGHNERLRRQIRARERLKYRLKAVIRGTDPGIGHCSSCEGKGTIQQKVPVQKPGAEEGQVEWVPGPTIKCPTCHGGRSVRNWGITDSREAEPILRSNKLKTAIFRMNPDGSGEGTSKNLVRLWGNESFKKEMVEQYLLHRFGIRFDTKKKEWVLGGRASTRKAAEDQLMHVLSNNTRVIEPHTGFGSKVGHNPMWYSKYDGKWKKGSRYGTNDAFKGLSTKKDFEEFIKEFNVLMMSESNPYQRELDRMESTMKKHKGKLKFSALGLDSLGTYGQLKNSTSFGLTQTKAQKNRFDKYMSYAKAYKTELEGRLEKVADNDKSAATIKARDSLDDMTQFITGLENLSALFEARRDNEGASFQFRAIQLDQDRETGKRTLTSFPLSEQWKPREGTAKAKFDIFRKNLLWEEDKDQTLLTPRSVQQAKNLLAALETGKHMINIPIDYRGFTLPDMGEKETIEEYKSRVSAERKKYYSDHFGKQTIGVAPDALYVDRKKDQQRAKEEFLKWKVLHFGGNAWHNFQTRGIPDGLIGDCVECHGLGHDVESIPTPRVPAQPCKSCQGTGRITSDDYEKMLRKAFLFTHGQTGTFADMPNESMDDFRQRATEAAGANTLGTPEGWFPDSDNTQPSEIATSYDTPMSSAWSILKNIA